ncbi:Hsp20/alpha crystallin family protein [Chryseolinea sp. H1M3-3]|uniref:Hsp20/alpha crystallin family protein n=1 Tax=Chryseolinea sp. H1M3-3 TaxID=3034144 RepID=UPI0023EA7DE8|nr:Hsp20/alpha crystallin family protein [Chryseolinea sp. H1M3-3]
MALLRQSNWPASRGSLLSDFLDDEKFFNFPTVATRTIPAVNVKESHKAYDVEVLAPGFNKDDFNISLENNMLTIAAENKKEEAKTDINYTRREFEYRSFSRSFSLPNNINEDGIDAKYENGILRLTLQKKNLKTDTSKKPIDIK